MTYPVVLLPGTLCDEHVWDRVINNLDPKLEVIAKPLGMHKCWDQELADLVNDLPKEFVLVGFSLGGIAALALLQRYPERVKQMVLVASTALADPKSSQAHRRQLLKQATKDRELTRIGEIQISDRDRTNLGEEGVHFALQMAKRIPLEQFACQTELACTRKDTCDVLAKSNIPVHLVFGSEDLACGEDKQQLMLDSCRLAKSYEVEGAGHWLPLSHPGHVANIISLAAGHVTKKLTD